MMISSLFALLLFLNSHVRNERKKRKKRKKKISSVMYLSKARKKMKIIFRINTKPLVSNVALRRQVFEAKANIDSSWRCSSDDKIKDDKELKSLPVKARSLSVESMKENEKSNDATHMINHNTSNIINNAIIKKERPKPVRENSYLTAVRSSPEVILRQKVTQRAASDDEERKTRRTSYLKATANDEYHFTSDTDQNSVTADDEESQQQLKV